MSKIENWVNTHDGEDYCKFCIYTNECPHGVTCYGGNPIEPPCTNDDELNWINTKALLESIKEEENLLLLEKLEEKGYLSKVQREEYAKLGDKSLINILVNHGEDFTYESICSMLKEQFALPETCYISLYMGISGEHILSFYLNNDAEGMLTLELFKGNWNSFKKDILCQHDIEVIEQYYHISDNNIEDISIRDIVDIMTKIRKSFSLFRYVPTGNGFALAKPHINTLRDVSELGLSDYLLGIFYSNGLTTVESARYGFKTIGLSESEVYYVADSIAKDKSNRVKNY